MTESQEVRLRGQRNALYGLLASEGAWRPERRVPLGDGRVEDRATPVGRSGVDHPVGDEHPISHAGAWLAEAFGDDVDERRVRPSGRLRARATPGRDDARWIAPRAAIEGRLVLRPGPTPQRQRRGGACILVGVLGQK